MNLYSRKQKWKYVLALIALIIVAGTIWYASYIAAEVQLEERQKIKLWSQAIKKKADLVKLTNQSFSALSEKETENVELWASATISIGKENSDYEFAFGIIEKNVDTLYRKDNIPLLLTDENSFFLSSVNMPEITIYEKQEQEIKTRVNEFSKQALAGFSGAEELLNNETKKLEGVQFQKDTFISNRIISWGKKNEPIEIEFAKNKSQKVYYDYSREFYDLQKKRDSLVKSFNYDLISNSAMVPVVFVDAETNDIIATNISESQLSERIEQMKYENTPISIDLGDARKGIIYFQESLTLKQLRYFPYIMLAVIAAFLLVAYLLFSTFRRAEQNQVWVGMAKETAHQLGTPLSSLMALNEILKEQGVKEEAIVEMNKDIHRLETITERFSKIGSDAVLKNEEVIDVIRQNLNYLKSRISKKIKIEVIATKTEVKTMLNKPLFEWVIENLTKNAVDAMQGEGDLTFTIGNDNNQVFIDVSDTGKGISGNNTKAVFEPGYTTKTRGWGLGLSLAKRIIEDHHKGKIYIKETELNKGTTFRILLPSSNIS
jgi:signal transduction histidine kinase